MSCVTIAGSSAGRIPCQSSLWASLYLLQLELKRVTWTRTYKPRGWFFLTEKEALKSEEENRELSMRNTLLFLTFIIWDLMVGTQGTGKLTWIPFSFFNPWKGVLLKHRTPSPWTDDTQRGMIPLSCLPARSTVKAHMWLGRTQCCLLCVKEGLFVLFWLQWAK